MSQIKVNEETERIHEQLMQEALQEEMFQNTENQHQNPANGGLNIEMQQHPQNLESKVSTPIEPRFHSPPAQYPPKVINMQSKTLGNIIRGESKIEYVPFQKKVVEYREEPRVKKIEKKRYVTEYREQKVVQQIPREVIKQDYYAIEHIRKYIPHEVEERERVIIPKEIVTKKYQYVPVQRQIVHRKPDRRSFGAQGYFVNDEAGLLNRGGYQDNLVAHSMINPGTIPANLQHEISPPRHLSGSHEIATSKQSRSRKQKHLTRKHSDLYESYISDTYA